ncbi:MAG: outer membrane protein TolC [Rickettsiaceae bacterium]|jgi:outer membrane protein|nr:outer membrane protein TolC [Rickettsiaceae bacterium]
MGVATVMKKIVIITLVLFGACISNAQATNLNQIFRYAIKNDPLLNSAEYLRRAASDDKSKACRQMWPQLSATASYADYDQDEPGTIIGEGSAITNSAVSGEQKAITATVSQTIIDLPKFAECRMSYIKINLENATYEMALEDFIYRISKAYADVLIAKSRLQSAVGELELARVRSDDANQGFAVKTKPKRDVDYANAKLAEAEANKIRAENDMQFAKISLEEFTGGKIKADDIALFQPDMIVSMPNPQDPLYWASLAEKNNLKLMESRLAKDVSHFEVKSQQTKYFPTVNVFAKHSEYDNNLDRQGAPLTSDNSNFSNDVVGVSVNWKFFSGGSDTAGVAAARHRYKAAGKQYEAQISGTRINAQKSAINLISYFADVEAGNSRLISAKAELQAVVDGVKAGNNTKSDLLDAQSNLLNVQGQLDESRYNYVIGSLDFWKSIGALSANSVAEINNWLVPEQNAVQTSGEKQNFWQAMGANVPVGNSEASDVIRGSPYDLKVLKSDINNLNSNGTGIPDLKKAMGIPSNSETEDRE